MSGVALLGPNGQPLPPSVRLPAQRRAAMAAYRGAGSDHASLANWRAPTISGQAALSLSRRTLTARINDLVRNDGWASAGLSRLIDNIVGSGWTLSAKPNARALGISQDEADTIGDQIEAEWKVYSEDSGFWCDAERQGNAASVLGRAARHRFGDGEALGLLIWRPSPTGYATAMHVIDPQRLSNPRGTIDSQLLRDGVELDGWGAAIAYHIQRGHPGDFAAPMSDRMVWDRIERDTDWGRPVVAHTFEAQTAGMQRGVSPFAPIIRKLKQITDYDDYELQAASLNAVMALFITTPFDADELLDNLGSEGASRQVAEIFKAQREAQGGYYGEDPIRMAGAQVNMLQPGEEAQLLKPEHPNPSFDIFVTAGLRSIASAIGVTYEQLTMDGSKLNYSSIRAMMLEIYRSFTARKSHFESFMSLWYRAWLEEVFDQGRLTLPANAPRFEANPAAWCQAEWIGVGRGWVDPLREADAAKSRLESGITTMEKECAEQGLDWKEVVLQQAREAKFKAEHGVEGAGEGSARGDRPSGDDEIERDVNGRDKKGDK